MEDGHADGEAVGDLLEDHGAAGVGELAFDFDAPVDGARVHDERLRMEQGHAGGRQAEQGRILARGGEHGLALPLVLDAEEVDDVGPAQGVLDVPGDAAAEAFEGLGDERGRAAEGDVGTQLAEGPDVGTRDAAVEDVAEDGDLEAGDAALALPDGEGVQQALGGVLVRAVAGVDHVGLGEAGEEVRGAARAVAQDDEVGVEGLEVADRVLEGLALAQRGGLGGEVDDVGAHAERGELEADAGAGAGLDEQVDDGLAGEPGLLLDLAFADGAEGACRLEHGPDFVGPEGLKVEQVPVVPGGHHGEGGQVTSCRDRVPGAAPSGAMVGDPVDQGGVEADVITDLFREQPLVAEDLLPFREILLVKR